MVALDEGGVPRVVSRKAVLKASADTYDWKISRTAMAHPDVDDDCFLKRIYKVPGPDDDHRCNRQKRQGRLNPLLREGGGGTWW